MAAKKELGDSDDGADGYTGNVSLRERISHFTWAWFTLTMSTGGISNLLNAQPHGFTGLVTIGKIIFIFFIVLLLFNLTMITLRFVLNPGALKSSLTHPTESLFFPTMWLSFAVLLLNIQAFGVPATGPWLLTTMRVLFWIYVACTLIVGIGHYYTLFSAGKHMSIHSMTPSWILPIFPVMLSGSIAGSISSEQPPEHRLTIIVAGLACQGLGFLIAFIMTALFLGRLMVDGLPAPKLRPGMFMVVGPPSFTVLALIGMSNSIPQGYAYFARHPLAMDVLQPLALVFSIFLWLFAFFFFAISTVACLEEIRAASWSLICWATVFPNVGFTLATINIGNQLESEGIKWVGSIMTILLVAMWLFNLVMQIRTITARKMLWPGKDEDRDELRHKKA